MDPLEQLSFFTPRCPDLRTLRWVWQRVHGRKPVERVPLGDDYALLKSLRTYGCSARDDDRHVIYHVRGEQVITRRVCDDRESDQAFLRELHSLRAERGDVLISVHDHDCAMDCEAPEDAFLFGVRLP